MRTMQTPSAKLGTLESQKGFTLIELSIVLVIIGLLVGGVIKGQELIKGARINNTTNAIQGYIASVNNYMGTYRAMPGDDSRAATRWTGTNYTGIANGNGDGVIGGTFAGTTGENRQFWQHLRAAGLIAGATTDSTPPANAFGGIVNSVNNGNGFTGAILCTNRIPGDVATRIDLKDDDGQPNTGDIRSAQADAPGTAATTYAENQVYTLCWRL